MNEDNHYDEDYNYDDSQDNIDNKYKHYFKFDPAAWDAWGKMLFDNMSNIDNNSQNIWYVTSTIQGFPVYSIPVDSYFSNTVKGNSLQYLGNNYYGSQVWKSKYFVCNSLSIQYFNHVKNHAVHFLKQPSYYKGMFDILN